MEKFKDWRHDNYRVNVYQSCGKFTTTVDVDEGGLLMRERTDAEPIRHKSTYCVMS